MLMKKVLVSALLAAGMICATAIPISSMAAVEFNLNIGPPALQYEAVPERRAGYVWAPGYWDYKNNNHVWVGGSHIKEREGYTYQPHRWLQKEGKWNLEQGRWDRSDKRD
jgi:hypothetical protein